MTGATLPEDGLARLMEGRHQFAIAIKRLLARNGLTHASLAAVAAWANPDGRNWLSTSQISYYRTEHNKILGPKPCDALGQLNLALAWLAGDHSPAAQGMAQLGKPPGAVRRLLDDPFYLRHPDTGLPMNAGDLFMIWIGRLRPEQDELDIDATRFSRDLARWAQQWCSDQKLLLVDGMPRILQAYPITEHDRVQRLRGVIAGMGEWTEEQIAAEVRAIAEMVGALTIGRPIEDRDLLDVLYGLTATTPCS